VTFSTSSESQACIQNKNIELDGFRLGVSLATEGKRPSMPPQRGPPMERGPPMGYGPQGGMGMPHHMSGPPGGGAPPLMYGNGLYGPGGGGYGPGGGGGYGPPPQHHTQSNMPHSQHHTQPNMPHSGSSAGYGAAAWGSN